MKWTLVISVVGILQISAVGTYAQTVKISLSTDEIALEQIFKHIEQKSEFLFNYLDSDVNDVKAQVNVKDATIEEVMTQALKNTNLTYSIHDRHITVFRYAQQQVGKKITGRILDQNGEPVTGANVVEKGSANGSITDADGNFSLLVKENAILVISFVGYVTQEIAIGNRTTLDVSLQEDTQALEEIVVVGYGTTRKNDLSMSVASIKTNQAMRSQSGDINSILQGRLSGLTIQKNGGDPLSGATYTIRGKGSRDDSGILWVVDGVPGAPYNWDDVVSVTVLKDAASAAIYGAQVGSGGVIMITTKQAEAGKVKIEANVSHGYKNAWRLPEVVTAQQYTQIWKDMAASTDITINIPVAYDPTKFPYGGVTRTDWIDEVFRTGQTQHYSVSLSGGSESIKALASFSYDKNEGTLLNTWSESLGTKLDLDFRITKWLNFSERASLAYGNGQGDVGNGSHTGLLTAAILYPRSATVYEYNEDGTPVYNEDGTQKFGGIIPLWASAQGIA
ncbi:MAG: carboxypeptidase-like regulatory domain-containing protein [Tannerella sp.]|nr:carboxypeptidase-like regulatory domain-containing protein [Tannerella sp.]